MVIIHWVIRSDFVKILPLGNILILIFTQPFKVFFKKLSCSKENGTKTKDTFTTIVQTTRKLGVCCAPGILGTAIKLRKITLLNALLIYMFFLS